jgi:glycerol kinase
MDNCDDVKKAIEEKRCLFGTVDSWLLYVIKTFRIFFILCLI